jgi:hypothetical protein
MFPAWTIKRTQLGSAELLWIQLQKNSRDAVSKLDCRIKSGNDAVGVVSFEIKPDSRGTSPAMTSNEIGGSRCAISR